MKGTAITEQVYGQSVKPEGSGWMDQSKHMAGGWLMGSKPRELGCSDFQQGGGHDIGVADGSVLVTWELERQSGPLRGGPKMLE